MSRQADQAHWYQRRQQMLKAWNHGGKHDLDSSETVVLRKRTIRADRLRQKSGFDREVSAELKKAM